MVAATIHSLWSHCADLREKSTNPLIWSLEGHKFEFCQGLEILSNAIDKSKIFRFLHLLPTCTLLTMLILVAYRTLVTYEMSLLFSSLASVSS